MKRLILVMTLAVLLAGCGGSESDDVRAESDQRADVLADYAIYQEAFLSEDAKAACKQLTGKAKRNVVTELALATEDGLSCESVLQGAMGLLGPEDYAQLRKAEGTLEPDDVTLDGDRATVHLPSGRKNVLRRLGGTWYVDETDAGAE